ncbi:prephenate/arogenate dehydrogenase [Roseofilum casamattae]|uniref:Prephenate/arogenate dehydrogenase n=1 Tax=Roseofilum casamattae BLCC-M143 TaxID=3022442 RepID=A0ABT7BVK1_9CYAN|nr:prephenate/arogenate dehydrogenase [Roseofilum casamattae]MDJ1183125.1 prephenate/arogenate dehydrogenase [Roseofilum casamattae BLCC-M143]
MKIGIIGLGLIGGSLALTLRSLGWEVLGTSRNRQTCTLAVERSVVDSASIELSHLAAARVIFICTPMASIVPIVEQLADLLSPEIILTDVGSVKAPIVRGASQFWPNFVGGHPMAGTAEQGLDAAQLGLFCDRPYVLTPLETTPPESVELVAQLAESLSARVYRCAPESHDRAVALISHLPVFISAGLITTCLDETNAEVLQLAQQLASSGFADTSRVGGGNPELGTMMARYNREALLLSLRRYRQVLDGAIDRIEAEDWPGIMASLEQTKQGRSPFL